MVNGKRWISYTVLAGAFFIGFFNRFSPATFAESIVQSFGLAASEVGLLAAVHFWSYTAMQIPAGIVVDKVGIRWPATIGAIATGVGAIILALSSSYLMALSGPLVVGIGMSLVFVCVMKNNTIWFSGREFGFVTGLTLLVAALGSISAERPALFLLQIFDWRLIFGVLGIVTFVIALAIAILWSSPPSSQSSTESTADNLPQGASWNSIIANPQIWLVMVVVSAANGTFYAFAGLWGTRLITEVFDASQGTASEILTYAFIPYGIGSICVGWFSDALRTRKTFVIVASTINLLCWSALYFSPKPDLWIGICCFMGLGLASSQVVVAFTSVRESVDYAVTGFALALVNMSVFLTTALIQFFYGLALTASSGTALEPTTYQKALLIPFLVSIAGSVAALLVKETYGKNVQSHESSYIR